MCVYSISSLNPKIQLHLKDILHIPSITKDLISVHKFAYDNNCYFQIHPFHYVLKSQADNAPLLQGPVASSGLYPLDNTSFKYVSSLNNVSPSQVNYIVSPHIFWHITLNYVLKLGNLTTIPRNKIDFCVTCCMGKSHMLPS